MTTIEMRSEVAGWLEDLDEDFLSAVHTIVGNYVSKQKATDAIIGYDLQGTPKYAEATMDEYERRIERANQGEYVTIEALKEEAKSWRSPTK